LTAAANVISAAASKERTVFNRPTNKPYCQVSDRQVEGLETRAWEVGSA